MHNFMRYCRQNRKTIGGVIIVISFLFLMGHLFLSQGEKQKAMANNDLKINLNQNTSKLTTNESTVSGETIATKILKNRVETIDQFLSYCNEKNLPKAYELLTDDCKEQIYQTIEDFEKQYYKPNFQGGNKTCSIENWTGNTYKIKIVDNLLETGKSNEGYTKQDYITVKKEEDQYKLNINQYIGKSKLEQEAEKLNVKVQVLEKYQYMDYEIYTIKVTNKNEEKIQLKTLYLQDENGLTYPAYMNELTEPMLTIEAGHVRTIAVKFYSKYISTKAIRAMIFSDLKIREEQSPFRLVVNL